jgi:hypothetical protein
MHIWCNSLSETATYLSWVVKAKLDQRRNNCLQVLNHQQYITLCLILLPGKSKYVFEKSSECSYWFIVLYLTIPLSMLDLFCY